MAQEKTQQQPAKKNVVWSTKAMESWMADHAEGTFHKENPWLDNQVGVKRAGLMFDYTPEEIEELTKSANDVIYFANHYGYCMHGTQGYKPITLRDYQEEMLHSYADNRFTCCMSSRQVGKCFFNGKIYLKQNEKNFHKYIEDVYYERSSGFLSWIKHLLLKIYRKL